MKNAKWRITFPIEKAEKRDDGLYIIGEASGPEVDEEGERMTPELIERFAEQINTGNLDYRDAHAKDGVLRDLGKLMRAWVNETHHLVVEVKLDETNPAAVFLFNNIQRGKRYGMSVSGKVRDWAYEFAEDVGKTVLTYKDVVLDEISNTTRPAWSPSFGTVLAKAIADAEEEEDDEEEEDHFHRSEDTLGKTAQDQDQLPAGADDQNDDASGPDDSRPTTDNLVEMYAQLGKALRDAGLLQAENTTDADSQDDAGDDTQKSEGDADSISALKASIDVLVKSNGELAARVEELQKRPATTIPPVVDGIPGTDIRKALSELAPDTRIRLGLAALRGEDIR